MKTLKGTWTIYFAKPEELIERIEIHSTNDDGGTDPTLHGGWDVLEFKYADGSERYFPWASVREARWESTE